MCSLLVLINRLTTINVAMFNSILMTLSYQVLYNLVAMERLPIDTQVAIDQ